jgi:5'-phosphate synthase pdxT subunit
MKAGVLALQGAFREHAEVLDALGVAVVEVRRPEQLAAIDALFLPGGESTTMGRLLVTAELLEPLRERLAAGLPTFGTCAGMILLAREVHGGRPDQPLLGVLDVTVERNAYGTQLDSFEAPVQIESLGPDPFPGVFIRAPVVERAGPGVVVGAEHNGRPVLVREDQVWASTFHPELSGDLRLHRRFLGEVRA